MILILADSISTQKDSLWLILDRLYTEEYGQSFGKPAYVGDDVEPIFRAVKKAGIGEIEWDTWGAKGARGTGLYGVNLCDPSCADGKWKFAEVDVSLSKKIKAHGKTVLTRIDIIAKERKNLPQSNSSSLGWDLERKPITSVK